MQHKLPSFVVRLQIRNNIFGVSKEDFFGELLQAQVCFHGELRRILTSWIYHKLQLIILRV